MTAYKKRIHRVASPWNIRQAISLPTRVFLQLAGIATVIGLYSLMSQHQHQVNPNDTTVPNFSQFVEGFKTITEIRYDGNSWIVTDTAATFGRLAKGMMISFALSVVIGTLMGCYEAVECYFGLIVSAMAKEPATAMLAAFFVLLGTGESLYVGVVVFGTLPWMSQAIFESVRHDVHRNSINKMITFNASPCEQIYNLVYKRIFPKIIDSTRIATSAAMIGLLAAEMQVGDVGFGYRMKINSRRLDMSVVYLYLTILVLIGYSIDYAFTQFRMYWCPWYGEQKENRTSWVSMLFSRFKNRSRS
jgi:ABC-type nitrate/sulfonate/bicarbonate transport system permease component